MKLVVQDVTKKYDNKAVIDGASFTFEKGKIYGLLGRNGAGKTTLFNCISQDLLLDGGNIRLETSSNEKTTYDNRDIGFVYATPHLPGFMTGYEFVKFYTEVNRQRLGKIEDPKIYLNQAGIEGKDQHRLLKDYSHGMQNKVQMLVTMLVKTPVLLLDEPLTSFDVVAAHEMKELIKSQKEHSVVIFSTHILQLAQDLCDEIVVLHEGKLSGIPAEQIHDGDFEEEIVKLLSEKTVTPLEEQSILLQRNGE